MFREMRLKREALEETAVKEILENGTSGVLALPKEYTSYFKSVIAFGKVRIMEDEKEIREYEVKQLKFKPRRKKEKNGASGKHEERELKKLEAMEKKEGKSKLDDN